MKKLILLMLVLIFVFSISTVNSVNLNDTNFEDSLAIDNDCELESVNFDNFSMLGESEDISKMESADDSKGMGNNIVENYNSTKLVSSNNVYYKNPFNVTLKDSNNNGLSKQVVKFTINNKTYSIKTNQKGIASLPLSLKPGKYVLNISYGGNDKYLPSFISKTINILPTIISNDVTAYYKGCIYTATFLKANGKALANTKVKVKYNGKVYTKKTNSKGVISISITLKPGSYKIKSYDPITGYSLKNNIKILSTITSGDLSKVFRDNKKFTAKFLKSNGKSLSKKKIKFKVNGKTYSVKTNTNGKSKLSLAMLSVGTYYGENNKLPNYVTLVH